MELLVYTFYLGGPVRRGAQVEFEYTSSFSDASGSVPPALSYTPGYHGMDHIRLSASVSGCEPQVRKLGRTGLEPVEITRPRKLRMRAGSFGHTERAPRKDETIELRWKWA